MGNVFDRMAKSPQPDQPAAQAPEIPQPVISPALDQRGATQSDPSITLHGVSQDQLDAATQPAPPQAGNVFDRMAHDESMGPQGQGTPQATDHSTTDDQPAKPTRVGSMPRLDEVWEGISQPLIPDARPGSVADTMHKYADSSPSAFDEHHPYVGAALKGLSGTVYDTMETLRSFTSPLAIGTLGLGELAKGSGAVPKVAKAGSRLLGVGFGAQGINDAYEGIKEGDIHKTLNGLGQALISTAAELKDTKLGGKKPVETRKGTTAGDRTLLRPTTQTTAGVEAPISATQQAEPSMISKVMSHTTTPGTASEFQENNTKPAARRQVVSTLSQVATDKIAAHEALANGEAAPASITGTQTPGEHVSPDEIWPAMQDSAGQTWDKARRVSAQELEDWNQRKASAEASHQEAIDHYNDLVNNHNADPANADDPMEPHQFDPKDANVPERPKTYDELKAELDAAKDRTGRTNPTDVREKAKTIEVPKAEKALDSWFKDHEDAINPSEYQSAKQLWADSERFREIANNLRGKLVKGTLTGNDIRGLEAVIDGKAITRRGQAGIGEFRRLMGPEAVENLGNVAKLFDPLEASDPRTGMIKSWGGYVAKHVVTTMMAPLLGLHYLALEGGNALNELLMNHVMFDPEFGSSFKGLVEATKSAFSAGTKVPAGLISKFQDMLSGIVEKYKASRLGGEEGAVGYGVKKARTGTPRPKTWPTDDKMIEKFGEASDPAHTAFLMSDGRKVAMPAGSEHDRMLGGKPTDDFRTPYINETGNIRMRAYGVYGDRQFGFSLPKGGITEAQLNEIKKWGPQLRTGRVFLEQADANGKNVVLHNATNEQLEEGIRSIVPVKESSRNPIADAANDYNKANGRPAVEHADLQPDVRRGEIADQFDAMKHDPTDPKVAASYDALKKEIKSQWEYATKKMGIKIEPTDQDPYGFSGSGKPAEEKLFDDVKNNKHLGVWRGGNPLEEGHPLSEVDKDTGESYNTMLRAVHDMFGHVAGGNKFGEAGEESAWNLHKQMFSKKAMPAMTTETRGQTSWFFNNADVRSGKKALGEFAPQKAGLLPESANTRTEVNQHIADITNAKGGATFNLRQGNMAGTNAYAVPMHPELSRTVSGEQVTAEQVKKYLNDPAVKKALAADPKLSVGTWAHEGKVYFDLSAAIPDREEAIRVGKENNQKAITNLKNFEEIPLGKEGTGTALETKTFDGMDFTADRQATDQAMKELADGKITRDQLMARAQELKEAAKAKDMTASEITTRRPKAVGADLGNKPGQNSNWDAIEQADRNNPSGETALGKKRMGYKEKLARTVSQYPGLEMDVEEASKNPDAVLSKFVNHVAGNLEWIYNQVPPEIRDRTKQWYDAAHTVVKSKAQSYGYSPEQGAGVTAALSPQNPWDNNIGLANRTMDIYRNRQNFPFSPEMEKMAAELKKVPTQSAAFKGLLRDIAGKKLKDVKNANPHVQAVQRALWVRLYDEAHGSPLNDQYAPTGEVVGHSPDTKSWIGLDHMNKTIKILDDGSVDNINSVMGQGHKIRNFYNNIINPNSKGGHVTIDTHAVAAGLLLPVGAKDMEAVHSFGNTLKGTPGAPKDASTGLQGTYPLYAEAYQRTARKLGILPRELQSVAWEAVKALMGDEKKTPELKSQVRDIWHEVAEGGLTREEARDRIKSASNGFSKPAWMSDEEWEKMGPETEDTSFDPEEELAGVR